MIKWASTHLVISLANSGCEVPAKTIIPRWSMMANQQDKSTKLSIAKTISGLLGIPFCHFCIILQLVPSIDQTFVNKGSACCCLILAMACLLGLNKSRNYIVRRRKPLLTANEQGHWRLWRRYFLLQSPLNLLRLDLVKICNTKHNSHFFCHMIKDEGLIKSDANCFMIFSRLWRKQPWMFDYLRKCNPYL